MRRAFVLVLFIAAPLIAQTYRLGPENVIPRAVVDSNISRLIALLPHGDNLVAFWGVGGPLHARLLDPQGKLISDTVVAEVPNADLYWTWIAPAGDGYLVIDNYEQTPTGHWRSGAFALDFDFRFRGKTLDLAPDRDASSIACGASRCAFVVTHFNPTTWHEDDRYVMLLRFDGSVAADRLPVPMDIIGNLTPIGDDFLTLYGGGSTHSAVFDTNGVVRNAHDYGNVQMYLPALGGATAVPGGAIVVWPQDETLHAAQLDANGVVIATNTIATFSFVDFEEIAVSCSNGECTVGTGWYPESYAVFEGVFAPVEQIHAVRFAMASLQPIDSKPVTIAIPNQNRGLNAVATPSGALLAWSAFRANSVRVAFLGRGATPYAGDPAIDGRPIMNGLAWAGKVAATGNTLAWTDFAIDGLRNIRVVQMDDEGVPASDPPELIAHDYFSYFSGTDIQPANITIGQAGASHVIAWNSNGFDGITVARGSELMTIPGTIATMMSDGREVVLATMNYAAGAFSLVRFGETGPPMSTASLVRLPYCGALSNGKLFLSGWYETRLIDLDKQTSVSLGKGDYSAFVSGDRSVTGVLSFRDQAGKWRIGVQRFGLDGHLIDAQPVAVGENPASILAVPLGTRVLIAWDTDPYGGAAYAIVFDPETRMASQPSLIEDDGRRIDAVVPRDATHAILVFRTTGGAVSTQRLEVASDFHHRAAK